MYLLHSFYSHVIAEVFYNITINGTLGEIYKNIKVCQTTSKSLTGLGLWSGMECNRSKHGDIFAVQRNQSTAVKLKLKLQLT